MYILGISAYYHDSAAALLNDGVIIAAAQEERFTRIKHDAAFPANAIAFCLQRAGISFDLIDRIVFYDKPLLKFERLLETYISFAPRGFRSFSAAMPAWLREKLFLKDQLLGEFKSLHPKGSFDGRLLFSEHHLSHAASAYYPSPYDEALVLTLDGVGEWATTSLAIGRGRQLEVVQEIHFPHSLGLLYSAFTYYLGFKVNSGEYKVMGLAPYGAPRYTQLILDHLIDLKPDGSFRLDMTYFDYATGLKMTNRRFDALFGAPARRSDAPLTQREMDLAASVQAVVEEAMRRLVRSAVEQTGIRDVCLAGGVALNCVGNGKVLRDGAARRIWVQPAAGDAGGALGAAYVGHHLHLAQDRRASKPDSMHGGYLGPDFSQPEIEQRLDALGAVFKVLSDEELIQTSAKALEAQQALGWFQGRMEFGPRALGSRSILADPRSPTMQSRLNRKIKFRESFRPFAPAVLAEHAGEWFKLDVDSPYMLFVTEVAEKQRRSHGHDEEGLFGLDRLQLERSSIPAVTHVDYSARVQTVHASTQPRFHQLLSAFHALTGCPVLVNTSFNVRGEPIVCTPEDAFRCFMGSDIDMLVVGNCLLQKAEQRIKPDQSHYRTFAPD